jgi:hypothetical protein
MGWFSKRLSGSQKEEALTMARHLQTMVAYQQLAMETYNDAAAIASGRIPHGSELTHRSVYFSDPALVAQYVIPAVAKKIEIFQSIEMKHREVSVLATANLKVPYQEMTAAINAWLERARYQYHVFQQWVNNPQVDIDTVRLDRYELAATDRALKALNDLIFRNIRLTRDEWLDIVQEAFNSVRASLKLVPLSKDTFRSQHMGLISGEQVRFFKD